MLSHSTLDDIEYSKYSYSTRKSIKKHRRRHHSKSRKSHKHFNNYGSDKCAVCLDDKIILDTKLFPCGHTFHGECLIQWVTIQKGRKFNCPLCRQDIAHFIQLTGNQKINDQLIQIWNEQYLYNTSPQIDPEKDDHEKNIKIATDEPIKCIDKITDIKIETIPKIECKIEPKNTTVSENNSEKSIWKFLWNSPLSKLHQKNEIFSPFSMLNLLFYPMHSYNTINNEKNNSDVMYLSKANSNGFTYRSNNSKIVYEKRQIDSDKISNEKQIDFNTELNNDLIHFSSVNFKGGIFAGICASTTTYLISQQIKYSFQKTFMNNSLRYTFVPILTETVPNVAIFFMTYEHFKKYVFDTNNVENTYMETFKQRFISAGIASTVSYFVTNNGTGNGIKNIGKCGLLPLRFATFFGTFELCKDLMDCKHENIGIFGIGSAAFIGGGISHSLYYPLLQYKNNYVLNVNNVMKNQIEYEIYHSGFRKEMFVSNLFKGWMNSLSKFLPSCVVCSCAFEYSKRYFNDS